MTKVMAETVTDDQALTVGCPTCLVIKAVHCTHLGYSGYKPLRKSHQARYEHCAELLNEASFHRSRRMFVLRDGLLELAPVGDTRSHEDWFKDYPDSDHWMTSYVRGFYDQNGVYLYIQTDAGLYEVTQQVLDAGPVVVSILRAFLDDLPVYAGMVPGKIGTRWRPRYILDIRVEATKTTED